MIIDTESSSLEVVKNEGADSAHGAGVAAARVVVSKGVDAVLTGNMGPKAFNALSESSIKILLGVSGTIEKAVKSFKNGDLKSTEKPTVKGHIGVGGRGLGRGMGRRRRQVNFFHYAD